MAQENSSTAFCFHIVQTKGGGDLDENLQCSDVLRDVIFVLLCRSLQEQLLRIL